MHTILLMIVYAVVLALNYAGLTNFMPLLHFDN